MASEQPLEGKVALISGGGTGIGRGIAETFARAGASLALAGRRREKVEEAASALREAGHQALAIAGDVSKSADCARMVEETVRAFGALHILVNNAGIARFGKLEDTSNEDISAIVDINLKGPLYLCKAALPELRKHKDRGGASILNISTSAAAIAVNNFSVYSAAKAGLSHLTRCLARDHGPDRVRVNAILPGAVETPIFSTMLPKAAARRLLQEFAPKHPLGRVGQPEDIAGMALFLSGLQASWITGALVSVDGGIGLG